jgi:hypothetical protein
MAEARAVTSIVGILLTEQVDFVLNDQLIRPLAASRIKHLRRYRGP